MQRGLRLHLWAILLFLLFPPLLARSGSDSEESRNFFGRLLEDQKQIWKSPFEAETWDNPETFFALGVSGLSFTLDDDPAREIRENESFADFNDLFASTPADVVLTAYPLAILAAGQISDNPTLSEYGLLSTRAAVDALAVTFALKAVTQRSRPHSGDIYGFWEGGNSFPSGHSAAAWAVATATVRHFDEHEWVPWLAYPLAGLISFSRISSGNHYFSDVAAGSFIGFFVGRFVTPVPGGPLPADPGPRTEPSP